MCKKFMVMGVAGVLGAAMLAGTGAWSYVKTGYNTASESVRSSVPLEFEIERARDMIESLKPEIKQNLRIVAQEEIGVQRLADEIAKKEVLLTKSRSDILRLKSDLESGDVRYVYHGRNYTQDQVREDLKNRFEQFQVHEATTKKLTQVLSAREKNLDGARRKLDSMLTAKRELEVEIENLQARLTMLEVAKTSNPISLDDSQLSRTRQLLDSIRTRIDVDERTIASEGALDGTIQLDDTSSPELLDEIADYFGEGRAEVESLVSTQQL